MKQLAGFYFDFRGGRTADDYFLNQHGVLSVGRHVCMFVVDNVLSRLKSFSFNKGKVMEVIVRIGSSFYIFIERKICSFFQVRIMIVFTSVSI